MKKKDFLFILFFLVITLTGCSSTEKEHHVFFTKDRFKVDASGSVEIKGRVSGLSKGNYKANIDRENQIIHLDSDGSFEVNSYIMNSDQKVFPIGIETPNGQIIVGSAPLDTKKFSKALKLEETVFTNRIIDLFKEATLSVENERDISSAEFPFKFREGIIFSDGTTKINNNTLILTFKKSSHFDIANEYFLYKSEHADVGDSLRIDSNPLQHNKPDEEEPFRGDSVFEKILLNYQKDHKLSATNPLYNSKIVYYQKSKTIMICENGILDSQVALYKQILDHYKN